MKKDLNEISLAKFLAKYVALNGEDLKKLTHDDVKALFPYFKRCTFDAIKKDPSLVLCGRVLLVNDGHRTIPYYLPEELDYVDDYIDFEYNEVEEDDDFRTYYDYEAMTNYELKELLDSKSAIRKVKLHARRELEDRGVILTKKAREKRNEERYYGEY